MRAHRLVALVIVTAIVTAGCQGSDPVERPGLSEGEPAPRFTLPSAGGGQVSLDDFVGRKPALLYFSMGPG
jgi:hypothetical protein